MPGARARQDEMEEKVKGKSHVKRRNCRLGPDTDRRLTQVGNTE